MSINAIQKRRFTTRLSWGSRIKRIQTLEKASFCAIALHSI